MLINRPRYTPIIDNNGNCFLLGDHGFFWRSDAYSPPTSTGANLNEILSWSWERRRSVIARSIDYYEKTIASTDDPARRRALRRIIADDYAELVAFASIDDFAS